MQNTVARFEFRVFGNDFKIVEKIINDHFMPLPVKESSEIYILSAKTNTNNCKIRYDLLDIKQLINVKYDLEQWIPKLKLSFPVSRELLQFELFKYLNVEIPVLHRPEYPLQNFIEEIVNPHPELQTVEINKYREAFADNECTLEIARVETKDVSLTTIGIESAEVNDIQKNRELLKLMSYPNENYVKALKKMVNRI